MILLLLAVILLLILVFIYFGIKAFAIGGTFSVIINSALPVAGGGIFSSKTGEKFNAKELLSEEKI